MAAALGQPGVSDRARLVLARMAVVAKDTDDQPVYFGGWPFLAPALGYPAYDNRAKQAVKRAVAELLTAGLIKSHGAPGPGHNVVYVLRI